MDKFAPATCELFGHLVFKGNNFFFNTYNNTYLYLLIVLKYVLKCNLTLGC